jgi:hypothetical protein
MMSRRPSKTKTSATPGVTTPDAPVEPLLEMEEVQGIAVPGFFKPHQTLIYIHFPNSQSGLLEVRKALRGLVGSVSTASQTLFDRRDHRKSARDIASEVRLRVFTAMSFSAKGLRRLTPGAHEINSAAFKEVLRHDHPCLTIQPTQGRKGTQVTGL